MVDPQKEFEKLILIIKQNLPTDDVEMVKLAYDFAEAAHRGQLRASGDPYIIHPLATAQKLAELKLDQATVIAGLLHDIPEETVVTLDEIKKNFGDEVAQLVGGITKLGKIKYRGLERYAENLRKMFVAMSRDLRVIFIKFADRLHNLQTLSALPPEKRLRIAKESLEIYAPIADRLGMGQIKGDLEDLAFPHLWPEEYNWLKKETAKRYEAKEKYLKKMKQKLLKALAANRPPVEVVSIDGRTKHLYSLYKKLLRPQINRELERVYDLVALRIIVATVADCYAALGVVHQIFRPMPGRIKDYISQPKPNGYQSLHTTVFADNGEIVEIQIRTPQMHEAAELGVAAHWHYKESATKRPRWIEDLLLWQKQLKDNQQFLQTIKTDIFQHRIFVFTPKGDVIDLPEEATPIDFAYHVHSWLGDKCVGAKVNDQLVSLDTKLKSGDIVEIISDKNREKPSADWLETAKTPMAKSKIRNAINKKRKKF